jgi:hypothetical protein
MDAHNLSSYRPISNLSFLSKVIERIAADQFMRHAETNHLFPENQSSYRRYHSTETALLRVHSDLVRAVDRKHVVALVLLDLSSAFDTVDHTTPAHSPRATLWNSRVGSHLVHILPI